MGEEKNLTNETKIKYHEYRIARAKSDMVFHEKRLEELKKEKKK